MNGYKLSLRAAEAERRYEASRVERKDILPWRSGMGSTENSDNFIRNQVTTADYADLRLAGGGGALGLSATWACVNLLAGTIASLPLTVYRTINDVREPARGHTLEYVLRESPHFDWSALDFWEFMAAGPELQGNSYAAVAKRDDGSVYSLTPLRPDTVRVSRESRGLVYRWAEDGREIARPGTEVFHIRGPLGDALSGASTLSMCRSAFNGAVSADTAAATIFANGVRSSGVLSTDIDLSKAAQGFSLSQREQLETMLADKYQGALNAGRPLLLDRGLKWQALSMTPEDSQMLESRRFGVEEICRIFGVPPHMIGHTENSTSWGTGLEQQTIGFVQYALRRRLKRIEQAIAKQLLTPRDKAEGITVEFNLEGLLRGDSAGRASFYQSGLNNGWMTINEVRRRENLPPVEGGDVPRMQMQNVPITAADGTQEQRA